MSKTATPTSSHPQPAPPVQFAEVELAQPPPPAIEILPNTPPHDLLNHPLSSISQVHKEIDHLSDSAHSHTNVIRRSHDYAQDTEPSPIGRRPTSRMEATVPLHFNQMQKPASTSTQTLTALAVGAPLIASVVSSCCSVVVQDLTATLGADAHARPARASVIVALLWCALVTSLGSTMTAVAGLAMHAGYHDAHVGVTKTVVRSLRALRVWIRQKRKGGEAAQGGKLVGDEKGLQTQVMNETPVGKLHERHRREVYTRAPSPVFSNVTEITDGHRQQHATASFRAAAVSARLLGISVALLGLSLAVYLFLLYPLSVALSTTIVGLLTSLMAATPLLPILFSSDE